MKKENFNKRTYDVKNILTPQQMIDKYESEEAPVFYWRGIEDISFGYVFGPSKAGKTIFCENFAMSIAIGSSVFFNESMIGTPKKVLIISMEENYRNRTERMMKQLSNLSESEQELYHKNVLLAGDNFPRFLTEENQWATFEEYVKENTPDVLIIDSFSRLATSDITDRRVCQQILSRLRNFAYDNKLALLLIHHATKNSGKPLTMDSMAGSSVMSQEADFSIGVNRNEMTQNRYVKDVFYRYKEASEQVTTYSIGNTLWLEPLNKVNESSVIFDTNSMSLSNEDLIINYLEEKADEEKTENPASINYEIKSSDLKSKFVTTRRMKPRTFDYTLSKIVDKNILIQHGSKGNYIYKMNHTQLTQDS